MAEVRVVNVVVRVGLGQGVGLERLADVFPSESVYRPGGFPALVLRPEALRPVTFLVFRSGRVVCAGINDVEGCIRAAERLAEMLRGAGVIGPQAVSVEVMNIVAVAILGAGVDLERAAEALEGVIYEPDQFPALIHRDGHLSFLIFHNGKMVVAGARSVDEVREAVERVERALEERGLLRRAVEAV